ncbi:alpha/beta fold hydrolase [Aeromicrobium ginsengisoli]|uniref:Alpha/beta hydrolase n=1 Tax=Aeromicrobium ginsengisoli TaxID=363867 RepID=A0A5M4FHY6_9ACTN|nr:alpha/beta hydrolase [Aeromicrobium ginsengisoli]KAA1399710.1 alpha/beta hydrolase [Aeromicrobium ginsengisoli]
MKIILVPGFWLGAWSWDRIAPALEAAGHDVVALTLPGLESVDADRSGIGLADHVAAIVAAVDEAEEPVVLVGHSGGGAAVHGAVDQRADKVARAIYVDSGPLPHGAAINAGLPDNGNGEVPLPPWELFREDGGRDLNDFTEAQLDDFRARAIPLPVGVARDPQVLADEARFDVPITLISTTFTRDEIDQYVAAGEDYFSELPKIKDVTIIELPTGHWPQFTKPEQLAEVLRDAV